MSRLIWPTTARSFQSTPPGYWTQVVGISLGVIYNKKMVAKDDAPKTLQDLLDPKWKGQIAIASPVVNDYALSYFLALDRELGGGEKSQKFFQALAAQKPLFFGPNGVPLPRALKTVSSRSPSAFCPMSMPSAAARTATSVSLQ